MQLKINWASRARHAVNLLGQKCSNGIAIRTHRSAYAPPCSKKLERTASSGNDSEYVQLTIIAKLFQALDAAADVSAREIVELE